MPRAVDLLAPDIAAAQQGRYQLGGVAVLTDGDGEAVIHQHCGRHGELQRRLRGEHDRVVIAAEHLAEYFEPLVLIFP